jgi:hypothetical protein
VSLTSEDAQRHIGDELYDVEGHKIGKIEHVFRGSSGSTDWVTVSAGPFGTKKRFVPIRDAVPTGGGLAVPFTKDTAEASPTLDPQGEQLSSDEEAGLRAYYREHTTSPADAVDPDRYRLRPRSAETTFGTGQPRPDEPSDVTLQGTGNSAPEPD